MGNFVLGRDKLLVPGRGGCGTTTLWRFWRGQIPAPRAPRQCRGRRLKHYPIVFPGLLPYLLIAVTIGTIVWIWHSTLWVVRKCVWDYRRSVQCVRRSWGRRSSNRCCGGWDLALDAVHEEKRKRKKYQEDHERRQREKGFKAVFDLFDKDGSGDLDQEELGHAYFEVLEWLANKSPTTRATKALEADQSRRLWEQTNLDGRVTFEEFARLCHRMMEGGEDMLDSVDDTWWDKLNSCQIFTVSHGTFALGIILNLVQSVLAFANADALSFVDECWYECHHQYLNSTSSTVGPCGPPDDWPAAAAEDAKVCLLYECWLAFSV
jgi:hypothetical protein